MVINNLNNNYLTDTNPKQIYPPTSKPRILITSMRGFHSEAYRSAEYEFEDSICQFENVDILTPSLASGLGSTASKRLSNYIGTKIGKKELLKSGCITSIVERKYDLFFFVCQHFWDVTCINSIKGWRENSYKAAIWIDEIWIKELRSSKTKVCIELLKDFDYVFTTQSASAPVIADLINRPCYTLPYGIDAIKFCPYPNPPQRNIDIYSVGRRSPIAHKSLLDYADQKNLLYLYDSLKGMQMTNYKEHRHLYSDLIKRSRYFITNKAKFDTPDQTGGQEELGSRFFEGAAGGAVMIGIPPSCEAFTTNFDWNDAVINIPYNAANVGDIIAEIDTQPERLHYISQNNIINTLLRHDWIYRWAKILEKVGLDTTPQMAKKRNQLQNLAEIVANIEISLPLK
jgi:Glycosyl transferases group 1